MSLVSLFLVFLRAKMDDFDDELRLTFEQTEMLRRICEAISYYGSADEWHNNRYDQMLLLSSVVKWIGISNEYLDFVVDKLRSPYNPEPLPKQYTLPKVAYLSCHPLRTRLMIFLSSENRCLLFLLFEMRWV